MNTTGNDYIKALNDVAHNLWWTWNQSAQLIFKELATQVWEESNHNAVAVLNSISPAELQARLGETDFKERVQEMLDDFDHYMHREKTWGSVNMPEFQEHPIAYFSPEFALHESLPIYSGGLGVLSGDHIKSASDLGIPLIGIGLFYRQGYFYQTLGVDGLQHEGYPINHPENLPLELVRDRHGKPVETFVEIGHSIVKLYAYKLNIGRITLYLMDSYHSDNEEHYRELTARTYGGDITTRICQEIVMGIGGVRLLKALGIQPAAYHMNEGHSAFLALELAREKMLEGRTIEEAFSWVKDHCVFTTHTPVPAGHDRFTLDLLHFAFANYSAILGIPVEKIMEYGRVHPQDEKETFCMTVFAIKMSRSTNAVSALHGDVTRNMWRELFPGRPVEQVPIHHITNGVHILGWMNSPTRKFWRKFLGEDWEYHIMQGDFWHRVADPSFIPDEAIWALRYNLRRLLIEFTRMRLKEQQRRVGVNGLKPFDSFLSPDVLTIGFSRRFATYKRAPLIFANLERSLRLFNDPDRPIQIIFAGKAHPKDDAGKALIKRIVELSKHPQLFGKVAFIENYDINVARYLISGADVWLNTPRRPLEASGTSGQKIAIHGGLNLSILDGWWREGYDGSNGFAIGNDDHPHDEHEQDRVDEANLYETIEKQLLPTFYNRDENNIPKEWINKIRRAMQTLIPRFNTDRMVAEYVNKMYKK
ncbi:alpha-glucan family phosphorylase [bacterium]|nr:alpha-glucan family phosphorylase [bacterium]